MSATLIKGKPIADRIRAEVAAEVAELGRIGLVTILVGDDPASDVYIRLKHKAAVEAGIDATDLRLPAEISEAELLARVEELDADPQVDAILVQLPLPKQISEGAIIRAVSPAKDVDGFGPESLGLLAAGHPRFLPCTPHGVQQLLVRNGVKVPGAHVVIVGRSIIVGKSLALVLLQKGPGADATVTVCHSRSRDIGAVTRQGDIVVVAIGQAKFLKADMVRPGAVVVDVGMNRLPDGKLAGDVDFEAVQEVASAITPVPGGVGPMTITMLLYNTLEAARGREAGR